MVRQLTSLLTATTMLIASPAFAQERAAHVNVPAMRLDQAIQVLGRQSGVSIGFRDARLAGVNVKAVRGRHTPSQALARMLKNTGARARKVANGTFLVEAVPVPRRAAQPVQPRDAGLSPPPPAPPPKEILVTGTKRDIPLGAYPGGVQIIDGESLSLADGARGTNAIEARIATVASTHLGPGRNKLFIRGIADSSFVGPTQATVGQYWGNSRITYSAPDPSLRLYDIRSVEVLEGPQGTLYGAGSLGGVVRVVPRAPDTKSTSGSVWGGIEAVQHGDPGVDGGLILNLPITHDLAFRGVAFGSKEGGYIDDTYRKLRDVNKVNTFGGRAALRYLPDNRWTIDLSAVGQQIDGKDSQYATRGGDGISRSSSVAQPYRNDYWLIDLVASKKWGDYELTSSVGYAGQYVYEQFDGIAVTNSGNLLMPENDNTNLFPPAVNPVGQWPLTPPVGAVQADLSQSNRIRMFTAEARIAKRGPNGTGWLLGVSLLHNEAQVRRRMDSLFINSSLTGLTNRAEEATVYGEGTAEVVDRLTVTFGGRLTHSRLLGRARDSQDTLAFRIYPGAQSLRRETRLLPSVAVAYRPTPQLTLFARYQESFRPGGLAVRRDFIQRFRDDRVTTTEAGARYSSREFDIAVNGAWTQWTNIQADLIDGFGFPTTANVGNGRVLSVGAVARWRPIAGLEIDAAIHLNKTKVTERTKLEPIIVEAIDGGLISSGTIEAETSLANFTQLPNIADVTGRVGLSYSTRLNDRFDAEFRGFARYVGKSTLGVGPILGQPQGDYVDTGMELRVGNRGRGISVAVTNLLDSRGNRFALGSPFLVRDRNQITPLRPRTVRLGFDVTF